MSGRWRVARTRLARLAIDVTPLRISPPFRYLYAARLLSLLAHGILSAAVTLHVFRLTQSTTTVATVGIAIAGSMMAALVAGGVLADRYDRRRLILCARTSYFAAVALLLANALQAEPAIWPFLVAGVIGGTASGISVPALMAVSPALIGRDNLPAAAALGSIAVQAGAVTGPLIAGWMIAGPGFAASYVAVAILAALTPILLSRLPALPSAAEPVTSGRWASWGASLRDGMAYVLRTPIIAALMLIDVAATLFATPSATLPQFSMELVGGDPRTVGMMFSALATGALAAACLSGWTRSVPRPGLAIVAAVLVWAAGAIGLGLSSGLWGALLCLGLMGFADTSSEILRGSLVQRETPDPLLGRVSSLWLVQTTLSPAFGGLLVGTIAEQTSSRFAFLFGGCACLAAVLLVSVTQPTLRRN